jgi:hypothetical protein
VDEPERHRRLIERVLGTALGFVVGVLVVALTPLLMTRRVARMDIPSTLRVVE